MRKKRIMKNRRTIVVLFAVIVILVMLFSLTNSGLIFPQTTEQIVIDTRNPPVAHTKYILNSGDALAQKFIVPDNVEKITIIGFAGFHMIEMPMNNIKGWLGISTQKTTNYDHWMYKTEITCPTNLEFTANIQANLNVQPGQVWYILFVQTTPINYAQYYYSTENRYSGGEFSIRMDGGWIDKSSQDAKFFVQAILNYGVEFNVLSAGAYPDHITAGQSSEFIGIIKSPSGGTCNVICYGNYQTKEIWGTQAVTFAQNEQKTITFSKSNIPAGTYPMAIECNVGGQEEAHKSFALYVEQIPNHAPSTPTLTGDNSLQAGEQGHWTGQSFDTDGDTIRYFWTVDGTPSRTSGYVSSGTSDSFSYTFSAMGSHTVSVKAEDSKGYSSSWATKPVQVTSEEPPPPSEYNVQISVVNSVTYDSISNAKIQGSGLTLYTDSNGLAATTLGQGAYSFTITKDGFQTGYLSFSVASSDVYKTVYLVPVSQGGEEEPPGEEQPPGGEEPPEGEEPPVGQYTLIMYIFDETTNSAISDAVINLGGEIKYSDSNGKVTYFKMPGTYTITVTKTGYQNEQTTVNLQTTGKTVMVYLVPTAGGQPPNGEEQPKTPGFEMTIFAIAIVASMSVIAYGKRKKKG